jgi:hypothetical protein
MAYMRYAQENENVEDSKAAKAVFWGKLFLASETITVIYGLFPYLSIIIYR